MAAGRCSPQHNMSQQEGAREDLSKGCMQRQQQSAWPMLSGLAIASFGEAGPSGIPAVKEHAPLLI